MNGNVEDFLARPERHLLKFLGESCRMPLDNKTKILVERTDSIFYYAESDLSKGQGQAGSVEMHLTFLISLYR